MARLRDIKVGMKVQIVKGNEDPEDFGLTFDECNVGAVGTVEDIDILGTKCQVQVGVPGMTSWYYPASWIKIIKDEGATKMTKSKTKVKPQKYILTDEDDVSPVFTDPSTERIFSESEDAWSWDKFETIERLNSGKMKLFKIDEVKLEITEPSIKIIG